MAKQDYYQTLGIDKKASKDEIKSAYKKLAREHHPDMVKDGDKKAAEERFKEINEAYQILSDDQKKAMYDQYGHAASGMGGQQGAGGGFGQGPFNYSYSTSGQGFEDINPFDIFEGIFGFRDFGGQRRPQKGKNLYYELRISFADAIFGNEKEVKIDSGNVKIKIPKGVRDGTEMRFSGKGMPGPNGLPSGDLFISFRVETPSQFQRSGNNLGLLQEIDFIQAVLGDTIDIPVIDTEKPDGIGTAKLKIPQGTQPGTQFRLSGKGMPRLNSSGYGDVIVRVDVHIPKRLSRKQKSLLEKYKEL